MKDFYLGEVVELKDAKEGGTPRVKVQLLREGEWNHPSAPGGKLKLTSQRLDAYYNNFKAGIRGPDIPSNIHHDDPQCKNSPSWLIDMERTPGKLYGIAEVNDAKLYDDLKNKRVKYVSPELLFDWKNPEDDKKYDVMKAFAWTNMPYIKGMDPAQIINLSEVFESDEEVALALRPSQNKPRSDGDNNDSGDGGVKKANDQEDSNKENDNEDLNTAQDEDALDPHLPQQCDSCTKLEDGSCPFQGINVKIAAAGDGNCPQYINSQAQISPRTAGSAQNPGGGGGQGVNFSEETNLPEPKTTEPPENKPAPVVSLADFEKLSGQVTALSEVLQTQQTALEAEQAARKEAEAKLELSETFRVRAEAEAARAEDRAIVSRYDDRLTSFQIGLCEGILSVNRGETVNLSEDGSGDNETVKTLLTKLMESIDQQVPLTEETVKLVPSKTNGSVKLADGSTNLSPLAKKIEDRAKEMTKTQGGKWQDHYGMAAREVSGEHAKVGAR
jgi:hypothetical protein